MKKKQKDNLIKAFEELNAPDKDVLLHKIESKKAFGGQYVNNEKAIKSARKKRAAWVSIACSLIVIVLAVSIISISIYGAGNNQPNNGGANTEIIDYRSEWKFTYNNKISFDKIDKTMREAGVDLIYEYDEEWDIIKTQITQDESMYREYYVKDEATVEVTVLLKAKIMSVESKYSEIINNIYDSSIHGQYRVYDSVYTLGTSREHANVIFLKDQVYVFVRR